jgi:uncharacterized protein YcaQ
MPDYTLTSQQARRFLLAHQGLWPPHALEGQSGVLDYVRRVGCLQFDPLNVVGRSPDLVLQARVAGFRPPMLQDLLYGGTRKLVDGWDKNAAIYPVEDWPFFHRHREAARRNPGKSPEAVNAALTDVRHAIEHRGPLSSIDLDLERTVDWSWRPTRLARATLESMCAWGELIIHHRVHTRKAYDFAHRHIPEGILSAPDPNPTDEEYHDWYVLRRIGSVGLLWNRAGGAWLGMRGIKSRERTAALGRLLEQDRVLTVQVKGLDPVFYLRKQDQPTLERVLGAASPSPRAALIAPLDNLLWDRRLVEELFDFSYVWEVYKPAAERLYGYYVLPVLYGDRFVARFEPERDRDNGVLTIRNWWWESGIAPSEAMRQALLDCFERFLSYLGTESLRVDNALAGQEGLEWLELST